MPTLRDLTVALGPVARTRPIVDGRVEPEGIDPTVLVLEPPERHRRMLKHGEFDVCELSVGSYLASYGRDYGFTAIPAFPYRRFRHAFYYVNANAGIEEPADLEGQRVGVRRWQNTAALWMRGIAEDYYGADMSTVEWYVDDEDEVPVDVPEEFDVRWLSGSETVSGMLARGELDALMYPGRPDPFAEGHPDVERLFPDFDAEERRYYRDTGLFPLMHVVVVSDDVVAEDPWVPTSLRKAFEEANRVVTDQLAELAERRQSLRWIGTDAGRDPAAEPYDVVSTEAALWADGLADVYEELETVIRYANRFGLLSTAVEPESLFVESAVEELPHTG